jgi:hypothetical protein
MINKSIKVRNEPESIMCVEPPLVFTEVKSLTSARYFGKYPVTIPGIRGAEAFLKLPSERERNLSDSEDSKKVRKRVAVAVRPFTR